jgi:hypothetical protein
LNSAGLARSCDRLLDIAQTDRFSSGQKTRIARQLPDLAEHPLGGFEQWEVDVGADIEDADLQRRDGIGLAEEGGQVLLLAGIERAADDPPARSLDLGDQRRQLVAAPPPGEDGEPRGGEFLRDRAPM